MLAKLHEMVKTGLSGIAASVVDLIALVTLVEIVDLPVGVAAFVAAALGGVIGFAISKGWAFDDQRPTEFRQVAAFAGVALGNAILVVAFLQLLVSGSSVAYPVAKGAASLVAFVLWSYPAQAQWVFSKGEHYAF